MPQSKILSFVEELKAIDLDNIKKEQDLHIMDTKVMEVMTNALNKFIPEKTTKLRNIDKKFFTNELKQLDRKRRREFRKHGKSQKFLGFILWVYQDCPYFQE